MLQLHRPLIWHHQTLLPLLIDMQIMLMAHPTAIEGLAVPAVRRLQEQPAGCTHVVKHDTGHRFHHLSSDTTQATHTVACDGRSRVPDA